MLNVYFAGTIMGSREFLPTYQKLVEHITELGHSVPTAHVARQNVLSEESSHTPQHVYERDVTWIRECDCLVAEVSTSSLGVGYETCYALFHDKPVLCLYRRGQPLSKMILGCTEPGMHVRDYEQVEEALDLVDSFLNSVERDKENGGAEE